MRSLRYSSKLLFIVVMSALAGMTMIAASSAFSQGAWSWVTVKPLGENFYVKMPKQPSQEPVALPNMPRLTGTAYSATGAGIYFTVKSIQAERSGTPSSRLTDFITKYREALLQTSPGARLTDDRSVSVAGFSGQQYRISASSMRGLVRIYSTRLRIYVLEVAGGDEEDAPVVWFLDSFTINEPPPMLPPSGGGGGSTGNERRDPTSSPLQPPIREPLDYRHCACDPLGNPSSPASTDDLPTRDAVICTKGELELTDEAIKHQFNGDVILEVELLKDGNMGGIKVVQSQPYGLEQKAVEAARQYKFCPALQDGQPVTEILTLTCKFRVSIRTVYTERPVQRPRGRRRP
jgi:TonB family protein